jgi:hypothetical protein
MLYEYHLLPYFVPIVKRKLRGVIIFFRDHREMSPSLYPSPLFVVRECFGSQ